MGSHAKTDIGLSGLERRKMVAHSYTLEAPADILNETCLLECVQTQCKIDREIRIMEILDEMD